MWGWLGRPIAVLSLGLFMAVPALAASVHLSGRRGPIVAIVALPLLLNLYWLLDPQIEPARGRFLFGASLWMAAATAVWITVPAGDRRWRWFGPLLIAVALFPVYLATMSRAVGAADTFEFQVVAPQLGIAHPTGYPLYLLLGKLFSLMPVGSVAMRLNAGSAVFALLAAMLVFRAALRLLNSPLPALFGAVALGLTPVFWSQAIVAEVYTLNALVVSLALLLMVRLIDGRPAGRGQGRGSDRKTMVALAFVLGLGLTNHITAVFLLPPAALAVIFNLLPALRGRLSGVSRRRSLLLLGLQLAVAFALPLLLYAYLPVRWQAINGEPMGVGRFIEWVVGGRFQGALQWGAWLSDTTRRQVVGRLLVENWGRPYLLLAAAGLVWLTIHRWRVALVFLVTAAGFTFYALNYYVPDLAVFLIPTHNVIALWLAAGLAGVFGLLDRRAVPDGRNAGAPAAAAFMLVLIPSLLASGNRWQKVDQSRHDGGEPWARAVLSMPLAQNAAILADSEKIAPLYYVQQIEGLRPDLDIMVLPDEAAYRAELDGRLASGQTVYLARFLPGLEGIYHLRSAGPLVEVSREPLVQLPAGTTPADRVAGPLRLLGYSVEEIADLDPEATGLTLYWTLDRPLEEGERSPVLYLRWTQDGQALGEQVVAGPHPVSDSYPVNSWEKGEVVPDSYLLPRPDLLCPETACEAQIQVAVAPRFAPVPDPAWQTVTTLSLQPRMGPVGTPRRAYFDGFALDGLDFPSHARPGTPLLLHYSGFGEVSGLDFVLVPDRAVNSLVFSSNRAPAIGVQAAGSRAFAAEIAPATETGPHALVAYAAGDHAAVCGWMRQPTTGCVVAEVEVSGAALPEGAVNFDDKIALLDVSLEPASLAPGGQLAVTITWQGLAEMDEDYTVFVQVLDASDRIVGQVDAWPVQGTRPTGDWRPGEIIVDPYAVQLNPDLPQGDYRVITGLYLLSTGRRIPVVDETGNAIDDKVEVRVTSASQ